MNAGARVYAEAFANAIRPDPEVTVSSWADRERLIGLAGDETHIPGQWQTSRVPWTREIMDRLGPDDPVQRVVLMKAARMAGSEIWLNWAGFCIRHSPSSILAVFPGDAEARGASKERVTPMIRQCPTLTERVSDGQSRDGKNTILVKECIGGRLIMTSCNSVPGLSWRTTRRLVGTEIDQWPADVGGEGDPLRVSEIRCTTFGDRCKIFLESPPTRKGTSRIEREYLKTDQRRYFIPCPECGHMAFLTWDGKDWFGSSAGMHHRIHWTSEPEHQPDTACMECAHCRALIEEHKKSWMLEHGEWRPTAEPVAQRLLSTGYHISSLYSPLGWGMPWKSVVRDFLVSKNDPPSLQVWVNKRLGETWEERSERIDEPHELLRAVEDGGRVSSYHEQAGEVPVGVGILCAAVDRQATWFEVVVKGYGAGGESWLVDWTRFEGDTSAESMWLQLHEYLSGTFKHVNGRELRIEGFAVDSRYRPDEVYDFCKLREHRRFADGFEQRAIAIAGSQLMNKPIVVSISMNKRTRCKIFSICTDTLKTMVYQRLRVGRPGPGFMHLPPWADLEYVSGLTSEKKIQKRGGGFEWKKIRTRNEPLDLEGYCWATLHILGPIVWQNLARRAALFAQKTDDTPPAPGGPVGPRRPVNPLTGVPRGGWMSRLKRR